MIKLGKIKNIDLSELDNFFCEGCVLGKSTRASFKSLNNKNEPKIGEILHTDLCGPMSTESLGGSRYFLLIKDKSSKFRHTVFLRTKEDVHINLKKFVMSTEKLYGHSVKVIRSDNGTEFVNKHVKTFLDEKGIMQETSAPYTPEQNGVAERENRTVVEMARTMLCSMNLPKMLWAEAVAYATLILNNTACDSDGKTPYERWTSNRSDLEMFKTFGCTAYYHIPKQLRYKLDPRSKKAVFVGIENTSKKIRLFDPSLNKIIISSSVIFNEIETTSLTAKQLTTASFEDLKDDSDRDDGDENQIIARDGPNLRPRSNLKRPDFYQANTAEIEEPQTYEEAVNG